MAITFLCPFYRSHTGKKNVNCEGGYSVNFETSEQFESYTKRYCRTFNHNECGIAKFWQEYYEEV